MTKLRAGRSDLPAPFIEQRVSLAKVVEQQDDGTLVFEAVVSETDYVNENRRIYPLEVLWPAFERLKLRLENHPGAVDHPDYVAPVSVDDLGIFWLDFWREGNLIVGRGRIIPTVKGNNLRAVIEAGVSVGFSTRGYGEAEEETRNGRTVSVMRKFDFEPDGSIDAVVRPSVRHARTRTYRKESEDLDIETLTAERDELRQKLEAAEAAAQAAHEKATAAEGRAAQAESKLTEADERLTALENEALTLRLEAAKVALENKITGLIGEHRFAATIRGELAELRTAGVVVTAENAEAIVGRLKNLVESSATASAEGAPRGVLANDEDSPAETPNSQPGSGFLTEEQQADLRAMGL
jgi:outer membrane murein-binding lipoprotein Lpp